MEISIHTVAPNKLQSKFIVVPHRSSLHRQITRQGGMRTDRFHDVNQIISPLSATISIEGLLVCLLPAKPLSRLVKSAVTAPVKWFRNRDHSCYAFFIGTIARTLSPLFAAAKRPRPCHPSYARGMVLLQSAVTAPCHSAPFAHLIKRALFGEAARHPALRSRVARPSTS